MLRLLLLAQFGSPDPNWVRTECPAGQDTTGVHCGWIEVTENRSRPGGRNIRLFVMRKSPAESMRRPGSAPIFFLDGGPGRAAHADAWWAEMVLGSLADTHPLVFMDQRGTGNSSPLECDLWPERRTSDRRYPLAAVRRCREELSAHAALAHYTTKDVVMDLEAVRRALGVEQLNLYGVSYGARLAAAYALLFPGRVRSMVLHSPGFGGWPAITAAAGRGVFKLAARRPGWAPDPVDHLLRGLEAAPLDVPFARGSRTDTARVGPRVGAWLIRDLLYDPADWETLRLLLRSFRDRQSATVISGVLENFARRESARSAGAFFGITCSEDVSAPAASIGHDWATVPEEDLSEVCREWPRASLPRWWGRAPPSTIPTLLLSGKWDPVTPADSAAAFAARMGRAHLLVVPRGGHGGTWTCAIRAVERFIRAGSPAGLPTTCR